MSHSGESAGEKSVIEPRGVATRKPSISTRIFRTLVLVAVTMVLPILLGFLLVDRVGRWSGCGDIDGRYSHSPTVNLNEKPRPAVLPSAGMATPRLRMVVAPVVSPKSSLRLYELLARYLSERLGMSVELMLRDSYAAVNAMLRENQCDLAFVCTYAFVVGERDFGLKAIAIPRIGGKELYYSYIIVRRSVAAKSLLDLRGHRFASADILSNSGWIYPKFWLTQRKVRVDKFFGHHFFAGSHDRSVWAVVNGEADGAAVDSIVYDHLAAKFPKIKQQTRIIHKSPPFGMPPVVVAPGLDAALAKRVQSALLSAHRHPSGRTALVKLGFDRFVETRSELYDSVRRMSRILGATR